MKVRDDLAVGVDKLYTQLEKAQDNVKALNATIALSEEFGTHPKEIIYRRDGNFYRSY